MFWATKSPFSGTEKRDPEQEEMSWHARSRDTACFRLSTPQPLNMFAMKFNLNFQGQEHSNVLEPNVNESSLREILHHSNDGVETGRSRGIKSVQKEMILEI